jgi:DNA-binding response OmpR family regulator
MRLLVVEDSAPLARNVAAAFTARGHAVDCVSDGEEADAALFSQSYDLVILDLGIPKLDGLEVLGRLRRRGSRVPVLILTARGSLKDKVEGLNLGADDYLAKPFALEELEARAGALMRRGVGGAPSLVEHGRLVLDASARRVLLDGQPIDLPRRELTLLEVLLSRRGQVISKEALLEKLFGFDEEVGINAVEIYVHRLRKRLEPAGLRIRTVRGLGYLLEPP